jgi:hypothetical protein
VEVFHLLGAPLGACSRTIATNCFPSTESLIGEEAIVAPVWKNQSGLPDPESSATRSPAAVAANTMPPPVLSTPAAKEPRTIGIKSGALPVGSSHPCREYHAALRRRLLRLIERLPLARFIAFEISRIQCVSLTASTVTA